MRGLKFRAWDNVTLKMSPPFALFGEFTLLGAVHDWQHEMGHTAKTSLEALGSLEVMQSTGLHDKNGRECYEGDKIKNLLTAHYGQVVFSNDYACFGVIDDKGKWVCSMGAMHSDGFEITGNIYENTY